MRAASPTAAAVPRSHKKKTQMNSQNPIKNPPCPNKKSAIANISILVAVLFACGFLLFPCLKFFSYGFSDFWKTTVAAVDEELGIANGFYLVSGFGFMIACSVLLWVFSCCAGKKCDNPNCRGLRNAPEFDIKIETEDCLKNLHNSAGGDDGDKGFFELGEDYNRELGAELKKMAPLNGRAVLIFRAKCGCSAGRMVVWGQKKTRKARMKNLLAEVKILSLSSQNAGKKGSKFFIKGMMTLCGKKMLHAFFMHITFLHTREIRILNTYYMNDDK